MMIEIKCYEVIGMCFFVLFFLTVKCPTQVLFQIKFPQNRCLVTSWEHRHSPDLIVFIVFHQFGVISKYLEKKCPEMVF